MFWWLFCGSIFKENIEEKPRIFKAKNSEEISPKSDPLKRIYEGKILNPKPDFISG